MGCDDCDDQANDDCEYELAAEAFSMALLSLLKDNEGVAIGLRDEGRGSFIVIRRGERVYVEEGSPEIPVGSLVYAYASEAEARRCAEAANEPCFTLMPGSGTKH